MTTLTLNEIINLQNIFCNQANFLEVEHNDLNISNAEYERQIFNLLVLFEKMTGFVLEL